MRKCFSHSVSLLRSRAFGGLGVKILRVPQSWPVSVIHETFPEKGNFPYVSHARTSELVYVLSGEARAYLGARRVTVRGGDYLLIPPGTRHRFVTGAKPMSALSVFFPPMDWKRFDAVIAGRGRSSAEGTRTPKKRG